MTDRLPPRRPAFVGPASMEAHGGTVDPVQEIEVAHETARLLVAAGRGAADPETTARFVGLVQELGLTTVADLWSHRPARSLPGALWRLYALREWVRSDGPQASAEYHAGMTFTAVDHVVAGTPSSAGSSPVTWGPPWTGQRPCAGSSPPGVPP